MKNVNAIIMDWNEFVYLVETISNGEATVENENGDWFYVSTEMYNADNVENDLSSYLQVNIKTIIIDIAKEENNVAIILE